MQVSNYKVSPTSAKELSVEVPVLPLYRQIGEINALTPAGRCLMMGSIIDDQASCLEALLHLLVRFMAS